MRLARALLLCMLYALPAQAITLQRGDVLGQATPLGQILPLPPRVEIGLNGGATVMGSAFGGADLAASDTRIYVDGSVRDLSLNDLGHLPIDSQGIAALSSSGRVYTAQSTNRLNILNSDGSLLRTFTLPSVGDDVVLNTVQSLDVSDDGCVVWYLLVGDGRARRFDVCRGIALPFALPYETFYSIRTLRGGGFAGATPDAIRFYDESFRLIHAIPIANVTALAFSEDGQFVWASNSSTGKYRIKDGWRQPGVGLHAASQIAVIGETHPSVSEIPIDAAAPVASPLTLIALSLVIAAIALRALR